MSIGGTLMEVHSPDRPPRAHQIARVASDSVPVVGLYVVYLTFDQPPPSSYCFAISEMSLS